MSAESFHFQLEAQWPGGRNAVGALQCGALAVTTSIDARMGGPGVGTNPDELFLAAASMCFFMTFAALVERAGVAPQALSLRSEMTVGTAEDGAFVCQRIVHRPRAVLPPGAAGADLELLRRAATAADARCMISRALRGNVAVEIAPEFSIAPGV